MKSQTLLNGDFDVCNLGAVKNTPRQEGPVLGWKIAKVATPSYWGKSNSDIKRYTPINSSFSNYTATRAKAVSPTFDLSREGKIKRQSNSGFYAYRDFADALREFLRRTSTDYLTNTKYVLLQVELEQYWEHQLGYRGQYQTVVTEIASVEEAYALVQDLYDTWEAA
jgi:hypothetical protein